MEYKFPLSDNVIYQIRIAKRNANQGGKKEKKRQ